MTFMSPESPLCGNVFLGEEEYCPLGAGGGGGGGSSTEDDGCWSYAACEPPPSPENSLSEIRESASGFVPEGNVTGSEAPDDAALEDPAPAPQQPEPRAPTPPNPEDLPVPFPTTVETKLAPLPRLSEPPTGSRNEPRTGTAMVRPASDVATQAAIPAPGIQPAAGAPIVALALASVGTLLYLAMVGFYNRVTRDRVAQNPLRQRILDTLHREPGLRRAEIAKRLSVHFTSVEHHLRILERCAFIESHASGHGARYFVAGQARNAEAREREILLRRPGIRSFLEAALPLAVFRPADVARRLGIPRSTGAHHTRVLLGAGILRRNGDRLSMATEALSLLHGLGFAVKGELPADLAVAKPHVGGWPVGRPEWDGAGLTPSGVDGGSFSLAK